MKTKFITIFVTCGSKKEAKRIVNSLLKKRIVACANIIDGIESRFWWRGKIDRAKEALVILKTTKKNFKALEQEVRRVHSYEVPEIIAMPIAAGSKKYLKWIEDSAV